MNPLGTSQTFPWLPWVVLVCVLTVAAGSLWSQTAPREAPPADAKSSYDQIAPVLLGKGSFRDVLAKDKADKPAVTARQRRPLGGRYDLTPRPDPQGRVTRGKPTPAGPAGAPRTRAGRRGGLREGMPWAKLAGMPPAEIREKGLFPRGFLPLPHPKHEVGGMVFPQMEIKQFVRLERFDVEFDIPEHFLPEF